MLCGIIFRCYHSYLTYHRVKHTICLLTSDKLEVRNFPLDIFAFLPAKALTCLKTGCESTRWSGLRFNVRFR